MALLLICLWLTGCGDSIGDSCTQSRECSQDGDRLCDTASPNGYCTVANCDFDTCPEDSVCVAFYPSNQLSKTCASQSDCTLDEICILGGKCAPRSTEQRFCMGPCEGGDDCRERYECRTEDRMAEHGGQPVLDPEAMSSQALQPFCAPARTCVEDTDCGFGDRCDTTVRVNNLGTCSSS